jgi:RNA polymerase sigma factor (sigma-70 family)
MQNISAVRCNRSAVCVEPTGMSELCCESLALAETATAALERVTVTDAADHGWASLMSAAQAGDSRAYRHLLGELRSWLVHFYGRRLPPGYVEDTVQEALIAIHDKRHTYDPRRPFKPWLAAIARHKWIDRLRSIGRDRNVELPPDLAAPDQAASFISASVLEELLTRLKPAQQVAIRLVKLEGFSVEEAAARTGQSPSLIKINIHRGVARLSAMVQEQPHAD